ncbi:hypothetical protein [Sediminibacterium sp.]|uniref:hypothetical protein n=1 Tax=Sediminibacterium sp. TaxID=1917865 RepID=UPI00273378F5|nr:hypothetical protein [Sediminibacterium sp.]MDP3394713.1 hypothetical protein [Sediminibacterium sp.]MDP3568548.1 hypothetical protein [Sediminibacterium sp.]
MNLKSITIIKFKLYTRTKKIGLVSITNFSHPPANKEFADHPVDIGTIGYFRDLKVTKRPLKTKPDSVEKVNGI